jgi:MFS family permease
VLWIGLPFYVYEQTGSALASGAMFIASNAPTLLFGSMAGVFVARWDRKWTMVAADILRALVILLMLMGRSPAWLWLICPLLFLQSTIGQFFYPAKSALAPQLVGKHHLLEANRLNALGDDLMGMVRPALGGLLPALIGVTGVIMLDAASFLVSGVLIALIALPSAPVDEASKVRIAQGQVGGGAVWEEWLAGLRLVCSNRTVASIFAAMGIAMFGQGIILVLWIVHVRTILSGGPPEYGWVQVAVAAGGLLGAFLLG